MPVRPKPGPDQHLEIQALKMLTSMPVHDGIGVCCSYLLQCSYDEPEMLRRVLNERVNREGFAGVSLLTQLTRVAK